MHANVRRRWVSRLLTALEDGVSSCRGPRRERLSHPHDGPATAPQVPPQSVDVAVLASSSAAHRQLRNGRLAGGVQWNRGASCPLTGSLLCSTTIRRPLRPT